MMLKICNELPDMYIMIAFIGSCLAGARASSQDFLSFNESVSSTVGGLRALVVVEEDVEVEFELLVRCKKRGFMRLALWTFRGSLGVVEMAFLCGWSLERGIWQCESVLVHAPSFPWYRTLHTQGAAEGGGRTSYETLAE